MNMPSLPTDNLYKFIALSGLAIVLLVGYKFLNFQAYVDKACSDENLKLTELSFKSDQLKKDLEFLIKVIENKKRNIFEITKDYKDTSISTGTELKIYRDKLYESIKYNRLEINKEIEWIGLVDAHLELKKRNEELAQTRDEIEMELERIESIQHQFKKSLIFYVPFFIFGISISLIGFGLWYRKKQIFEDLIIKKESEKV